METNESLPTRSRQLFANLVLTAGLLLTTYFGFVNRDASQVETEPTSIVDLYGHHYEPHLADDLCLFRLIVFHYEDEINMGFYSEDCIDK